MWRDKWNKDIFACTGQRRNWQIKLFFFSPGFSTPQWTLWTAPRPGIQFVQKLVHNGITWRHIKILGALDSSQQEVCYSECSGFFDILHMNVIKLVPGCPSKKTQMMMMSQCDHDGMKTSWLLLFQWHTTIHFKFFNVWQESWSEHLEKNIPNKVKCPCLASENY